jgi:Protein of unknown function (DUF1064)
MSRAWRMTPEQYAKLQSRGKADVKPAAKPSKMHNVPTIVDGVRFSSKREAERWKQLVLLQASGRISELQRQVPFRLEVNGILICRYYADFCYRQDGRRVIEDAKGFRTPTYQLKCKLMAALGNRIVET